MRSLILLLFTTSLFAQTKYPAKKIIDGDTLILITCPQLKKLNETFVRLDFCLEEKDTLQSISKRKSFLLTKQSDLIETNSQQLMLQRTIIDTQGKQISIYKSLDKSSQRSIKWLKLQRTILFITTAIAAGIILIHH